MKYGVFVLLIAAGVLAPVWAGFSATNYIAEAEQLIAQGQLRAAELQLKNAVRAEPANMLAHYRLATVQLQLGDPAAAEHEAKIARANGYDPEHTTPLLAEAYLAQQKYRQLLEEFPGTEGSAGERAGVLVARGAAQLGLGNREEAHTCFKTAQQLAPNATGPLLAEAKLYLAERQFAAAEPLADRALQIDPSANDARLVKAQLLRSTGKSDDALAKLNELLAATPSYTAALVERAELLLGQSKTEQAKADIDAVQTAQPGSVRGIYLRVLLNVKEKKFEEANTNLQKISKTLAALPRGYFLQALVSFQLKQLDQAADAAKRHTARNPEDVAGQKLLALIELSLGRPAGAVDALSKFESAGTADAEALELLALAYTQTGNTAQALSTYSAAVKLAPQNAALHARLGQAALRAGRRSEGITELEQSLDLSPSAPAAEMLVLSELAAGQWQRALDAANRLQDAQSNSPVPGNLRGVIKLARLEIDEAAEEFAQVISKYPDFLPAQLNQARVLELQGKFDKAEEVLTRIRSKQPANSVAVTRLVDLLVRNGKAEAAVSAAERAHAAAPGDQGITVGLIELYLRRNQPEKALELAQQETREKGSNADAGLIAARARAEFAAGKKNEAAQSYRQLVSLYPSQIAFRRQLATVLLSVDDLNGAAQVIDDALAQDPKNRQLADDRIAIALKIGGATAAVDTANKLKRSYPEVPFANVLDGDAYLAAKDYNRAAEVYARVLQQAPSGNLAVRLASAKAGAGGPDAGAAVLREWVSTHPDDVAAAGALANLDLNAQRFDEARNRLEQVVQKSPQDAIALNNLAWLYQRGKDPRARSLAERAYLLAPNLPQTADTLGWILVQEGQATKGLVLLKEAAHAASGNPSIRYHFAVALKDAGQREQSLDLLKELISAPGNFEEKAAAEKLLAELSR